MSLDESVFYRHYRLSFDGHLEGIPCVDPDHGILHPFFDFDTEKVYYECLSCTYRVHPGLDMYDRLRAEVENIEAHLGR